MKFAMSYSGGKDSALALYRMVSAGHTPVALLTTINTRQERSWFHGIQRELLQQVADSLEIPLLACECEPEAYTQALEDGLKKAKEMGAQACAFGDIDIEEHREWDEERCKNTGLEACFPLWQQNREQLTQEVVEAGFKAMIKIVQSDVLDESFLGQILSEPLVQKIKEAGADPCGENGEYHTFVFDGPVFSHPVAIKTGKILDFGSHKAIDIVPV